MKASKSRKAEGNLLYWQNKTLFLCIYKWILFIHNDEWDC